MTLFLTEEIVQGESVQTTSELQELLFEHIEREQREYPNTGTGAARFTGAGNVKSNTLPGEPCQLAWLSLLHPRLI